MAKEHVWAVLNLAGAEARDGWWQMPEGKAMSLYAGRGGVGLTVSRILALREEGLFWHLRTAKGDTYVVDVDDVFAGAVEGGSASANKAGFL
jgi:hypothetical protein